MGTKKPPFRRRWLLTAIVRYYLRLRIDELSPMLSLLRDVLTEEELLPELLP